MWFLNRRMKRVLQVSWKGEVLVSRSVAVQKLVDYLWLRKSGSKVSLCVYCWQLSRLCLWAKVSPDDVLSKSREDLETSVQKYLDDARRQGLSASSANTSLACLKTFFRLNGFNRENNQDLRLQSYHQPPRTRVRLQYVPTLSETHRMTERTGNRRNRAFIHTLLSTGLRNTATRAIRVKDVIKENEDGCENLLIKVEPEWSKRIPGACKNSIPYYTFTSAQATKEIKEMLDERREKLGSVGADEPLFISAGSRLRKRSPLSAREVIEIVKNSAKQAGIKEWKYVTPHSLRKTFESVLRSPLRDGGRMDTKDQEFLMGHILPGTQDAYYDWTKINRLREEYSKLVFEERTSPELENLNMYREMAKILGLNPDEVKKKKQDELQRQLTPKEEKDALEAEIKSRLTQPREDQGEQKIIRKEELQTYLDHEWKFVSILDQQLIIIKRLPKNTANLVLSSLIVQEKEKI
jgi:site-specific recombinase XerD